MGQITMDSISDDQLPPNTKPPGIGTLPLDPALFKVMAEAAPVIILLLDTQGFIQYANPYFEQLTGCQLDEITGKEWFTTFLPARDQDRIRVLFQAARRDVPTRGHVNPIVIRNGEEREIEWNDQTIRDAQGNITSVLAIGADITARVRAEAALRSSEARLNEAQRMANVGSWNLDLLTDELLWSDEIFHLFEIDKTQFGATYEAFLDAIHPDDRDSVNKAYTGSLMNRTPYAISHRLLMSDGRVKWVEERGTTDFDVEGKPLRSVGTVQEITERKQAEMEIVTAKNQLEATLNAIPDLLFEVGLDGHFYDYHSPRTELLAASPAVFIGKKISDILPPDVAAVCMSALRDAHEKGQSHGKQYELRLPHGRRWFELSIARKPVPPEQEPRFIALSRDITERKQAEVALRQTQRILDSIVENIPVMVFVIRAEDLRFELFNRAGEKLLGYPRSDLIGKNDYDFFPKEQADFFTGEDRKTLASGTVQEIQQEPINTASGEIRYLHTWKITLCDEAGEPTHLLGLAIDITERMTAEEQIRSLAFHDPLTKLPNRRLLNDRLAHAMAASYRSGRYGALMFLDLDDFKPLNDAYGHDVGDALLVEAARRIAHCVREVDTVARFGGDEFVVVLGELGADKESSVSQVEIVAEKTRLILSEPYTLLLHKNGESDLILTYRCTSSIGVALFIKHEYSPQEIIKRADTAMYQAKKRGGNLTRFYDLNT